VSGLADLLTSILERGIVIAFRLDGPPGDRKLLVGFGTIESADALMMALGFTSLLRRQHAYGYEEEWAEAFE
jgi:hypothetical protein